MHKPFTYQLFQSRASSSMFHGSSASAVRYRRLKRGTWNAALLVLCIGLCFTWTQQANAQAWTMPRGSAYVKLFYGNITAGEQFTFDGRETDYVNGLPGDTYRDRSLYLYSEFGLSDHFSMILSVPYKRTFVRDHAFRFRIFGLGSVSIGGRLSLLPMLGISSSRQALALNLMAYVPTGYTRNFTPSTGAGQLDFQSSLFWGMSFHPFPGYAQLGAGYRHRSSIYLLSQSAPCISGNDIHCITDPQTSYGDELVFHAETGIAPFGGFILFQAIGSGIWSMKKPDVGFSAINPFPTHQRLIKAGAGITLYPLKALVSSSLDSIGFSAQYFITPYGRNTINSRDLFLGVEFRPNFY